MCPTWRGEKYVAKGGIFFGDCLDCGWPKADHQAVDNGGPS